MTSAPVVMPAWLLKRLIWMIMNGMNRRRRKVEIAAPRPNWFCPLKERRHMTKASVAASSWLEPGAIARMRSKIFRTPMIWVTKTTVRTGARRAP